MRYGVIYKITCSETGKSYIGRTKQRLHKRWADHCLPSSHCRYLKRAIAKYGRDSFTISEIASSWDSENLKGLEAELIRQEGTMVPHGYNLVNNGAGISDISDETREKHRLHMVGNQYAVGTIYTDALREKKAECGRKGWTPARKAEHAMIMTGGRASAMAVKTPRKETTYTYNGETLTKREWASRLGVHHKTIHRWVRRFGIEKAFERDRAIQA